MKRDPQVRERILAKIHWERERQHQKFGRQALNHNPGLAMFILTEELGEVAKAALDREGFDALQKELIQTAAVCVQWLEDLVEGDREMAWSKVEEMVSGGRMSDTVLQVRRMGPGICPTCGAATECEHWPKVPSQVAGICVHCGHPSKQDPCDNCGRGINDVLPGDVIKWSGRSQEVKPPKHPTIRVEKASPFNENVYVHVHDNTEQDRLTLGKKR